MVAHVGGRAIGDAMRRVLKGRTRVLELWRRRDMHVGRGRVGGQDEVKARRWCKIDAAALPRLGLSQIGCEMDLGELMVVVKGTLVVVIATRGQRLG